MRFAITGAFGFVGQWIVDEFVNNDIDVVALVRSSRDLPDRWKSKVQVIECSLEQLSNINENEFGDRPIDLFFHFAWEGTAGNSRADIPLQLNNVQYTCDAVRLASKLNCRRFVNAGSIMEYEAMKYIPMDSITPGLSNIYSVAKMTADFMAKTVATNVGIEYVNVIISNIYGSGEKSARFLNTVLRKMIHNEDIPLTHGEQMYDFIYASDAAKAIYLAGLCGKNNSTYYIGSGQQKKLKEFVMQMKQITNSESRLLFGEVPFNGAMLTYKEFDTEKVRMEIGFEPYISFEEGIKRTLEGILKEQ